jgi:4'-phosphopantetheinyl transferase
LGWPPGKPHLAGGAGARSLRFNLAHADDLALVAVARGREVGVDVEREHPERADLDVARRMFAPPEAQALAALPPRLRARAFFTLWTIREAYAKGTGLGLAGTEAAPLPASWTVRQLPIDAGYAAALAVEHGAPTVRRWQWSADAVPAAA